MVRNIEKSKEDIRAGGSTAVSISALPAKEKPDLQAKSKKKK